MTLSRRTALLIAFQFPPMRGSSGLQRVLGFSRYLPDYGWNPVVLAPKQRAYTDIDASQLKLIPDGTMVHRSFCIDTARHLAIAGRYPGFLAVPDRWISWVPGAVIAGLRTIRRHRPSVLWSTYPIASTHIVGRLLSRLSGIPWVADFRDPMVERNPRTGMYAPPNHTVRKSRLRIEESCVENAEALVFCTSWARDICSERYAKDAAAKSHVISNGYEESSFAEAEQLLDRRQPDRPSQPLLLVHSGTIYPTPDRDPTHFFDALSELKRKGELSPGTLRVILRATGHDEVFRRMLSKRGIDDIVELAPPLPYTEALAEMMAADGLLLFQGYTSNPAIPAKLYEYLRAGKPILALVDAKGSTASLLAELGTGTIASIEDSGHIEITLAAYTASLLENRQESIPANERVARYSRSALTGQLAEVFDSLCQ